MCLPPHFLKLSTSQNATTPRRFKHFDFQMCSAPEKCALFRHLDFQSGLNIWRFYAFLLFWLRHGLGTAVHFCDTATSKSSPVARCDFMIWIPFEMRLRAQISEPMDVYGFYEMLCEGPPKTFWVVNQCCKQPPLRVGCDAC